MENELREQLAAVQHEIWSHWMKYMFGCGEFRKNGTWVMPADELERWWRQKETPYSELTDKEQESDRHQADKMLAVVQPALAAATARAETAEAEALAHSETCYRLAHDLAQAEAKLAAVPVEAIQAIFDVVIVARLDEGPLWNDVNIVMAWLAQQSEVQP